MVRPLTCLCGNTDFPGVEESSGQWKRCTCGVLQLFSTTCYCIGLRKSLFMVWSWKKYKRPECGLALMSELFFQVLKNLVVPGRVSSMGGKVLKWNQWALLPTAEPKICAFVDWYSKNVLGPYMCEATPTQMFNQNLGICTQHWNSHPLLLIQ